jgi:uncharacterized protein YegP (UPF0339 family)
MDAADVMAIGLAAVLALFGALLFSGAFKRRRQMPPVREYQPPGEPAVEKARFEVFKDRAGEWRWRLRAANGRIIADSGEGYKQRARCLSGLAAVQRVAPAASVVTV